MFYLFVLLFYNDYTMKNQVHNNYDIYAFYAKYPHIAHFPTNAWECTSYKVCDIMRNFSSFFLRKCGDQEVTY